MKCHRCGREITEEQSYVYQNNVFCDDCLMDIGLSSKDCDPWATYVDKRARESLGLKDSNGLTEMEQKVYEFVKSRGRATRAEVMKNLDLSEPDLNTQLAPLLHADLVKEHSQSGKMYLIPIPVAK